MADLAGHDQDWVEKDEIIDPIVTTLCNYLDSRGVKFNLEYDMYGPVKSIVFNEYYICFGYIGDVILGITVGSHQTADSLNASVELADPKWDLEKVLASLIEALDFMAANPVVADGALWSGIIKILNPIGFEYWTK